MSRRGSDDPWFEDAPVVRPPDTLEVTISARVLLVDRYGRRLDRAIGFGPPRYISRDDSLGNDTVSREDPQ